MNKLQGKVAIITGGASGMGEATAHQFAAHGARAIVIADVQDEKGQKVATSIGSNICTYIHHVQQRGHRESDPHVRSDCAGHGPVGLRQAHGGERS